MDNNDYTKQIKVNGKYVLPIVEFSTDDWTTIYEGVCIEQTLYTYLIKSKTYGTYWIGKHRVRLKNK